MNAFQGKNIWFKILNDPLKAPDSKCLTVHWHLLAAMVCFHGTHSLLVSYTTPVKDSIFSNVPLRGT
jgi:hypothetical protein